MTASRSTTWSVTSRNITSEWRGQPDGENVNYSENYGVEGETGDPAIQATRLRQIKNLLTTLFIFARGSHDFWR